MIIYHPRCPSFIRDSETDRYYLRFFANGEEGVHVALCHAENLIGKLL